MNRFPVFMLVFTCGCSCGSSVRTPLHSQPDGTFIIADRDLEDVSSMTKQDVTARLAKGALAGTRHVDVDGVERPVEDILLGAARRHRISLKVILVMLQKEQSLVERPKARPWQMDMAMGFGDCDPKCPSKLVREQGKGFAKQVDAGARVMRKHYDAFRRDGHRTPMAIDGVLVVPANAASAALYRYTPHRHGNELFRKIWQKWFGQSLALSPSTALGREYGSSAQTIGP